MTNNLVLATIGSDCIPCEETIDTLPKKIIEGVIVGVILIWLLK